MPILLECIRNYAPSDGLKEAKIISVYLKKKQLKKMFDEVEKVPTYQRRNCYKLFY